jgi:dihydroorotase
VTRAVAVLGGRVYRGGRFERADLRIEDGRVARVAEAADAKASSSPSSSASIETSIDARGCVVLPGLLDVHVHFREPGLERKEGWASGSRGALHGGVTSVLEVQNNPPLTTSAALLAEREAIVRGASRVDFGLFPNLVAESAEALSAMAATAPAFKLFLGGSTGMGGTLDYGLIRELFRAARAAGRPVVAHAEEDSILRRDRERHASSAREHHLARSVEAETVSIAAAIELAAATGASLHVFHVSTGRGADLIAQARASGLPVSASTSPHYLLFTCDDAVRLGNLLKVNPSVKSRRDRDRLCERLADGTLAAIGTDHAPHPIDEKRRPYAEAPSGVPSVDLVVPLLVEIAATTGLALERLVDAMSAAAADCFGVRRKGRLEPGDDADLSIVNLEEPRAVRGEDLPSRSRWSPYEGRSLRGFPRLVMRRGTVVFAAGAFAEGPPAERLELDPPKPG